MSTNPIVITPSTSVVLVNTADYSGNPVVLLPNLAGPGALGRIITIRDNDGGSLNPAKSIYLSTTGGALFQPELSSVTLSTIRITQPYGFITITPRLTDSLGNTNYGLMNVYAFPEASPAAYVNTLNANFSYLSTLSTANLEVSQNTIIQGNLTIGGSINYVSPGGTVLDIGRVNTNLISAASVLNSNFYGVNAAVSTINTSSFVVRDVGAILMPNAGSWSNAASFAGAVDANSLTLGNPTASAGAQIGVASNFFGMRSFSQSASLRNYSTTVVMRDRNVGINPVNINIGEDYNNFSNYRLYVNGAVRLSNEGLGLENDILLRKQTNSYSSIVEVTDFGPNLGTFRIDSSSNITEGFFGSGNFDNKYKWLSVNKAGSIQFWTGSSSNVDTTSRVTIDNTGRVGIGTTAPAYTLDVSGELRVSGTSRLGSPDGPSIIGYDTNAYMVLGRGRQVPGGSYIDFDISASLTPGAGLGSRIIRNSGADASFNIINYGSGNLQFGTNGASNRMVIDASGRVGIGTTLPSSLVTIASRTGIGDSSGNPALSLVGGDFGTGRGNFWMRGSGNGQALHIQPFIGSATDITQNPGNTLINPYSGRVGIGFGAYEGGSYQGGLPQALVHISTNANLNNPALRVEGTPHTLGLNSLVHFVQAGNSMNNTPDYMTNAILRLDTSGSASSWNYISAVSTGTQRFRLQQDGYMFLGGSFDVSGGRLSVGANDTTTTRLWVKGDTESCIKSGFIWGDWAQNAQLIIQGATNPNKRLALGFDTVNDVGVIGAINSGFNQRHLILQPNSSNVGIGTITPDAKLDISGGGAIIRGTTRAPVEINTDTTANVANIEIGKGRAADGNSYIDFISQNGESDYNARIYRNSGGNASFDIINKGTGNINFGTQNRTTDMIIDSAGNVGIGTTPTTFKLDVNGKINIQNSATNRLVFSSDINRNKISLWGGDTTTGYFGFGIDNNILRYNVNTSGDNHVFYQGDTNELMRIQGNGNVGIGCNAPSVKLDVNGSTKITGNLNVTGSISATVNHYFPDGHIIFTNSSNTNPIRTVVGVYYYADGTNGTTDYRQTNIWQGQGWDASSEPPYIRDIFDNDEDQNSHSYWVTDSGFGRWGIKNVYVWEKRANT